MVVADHRPTGPLAAALQLLLVALLAGAFGDESCEAGSDQCSGRAALLERQLEPEVYSRLEQLEILTDEATAESVLDTLLDTVLEESASTARAIGLVRKQLKIAGDLREATIEKALATWSKVLLKKRQREAAPPAAERKYEEPEEPEEPEDPEDEKEVLMEMSGEEMREQMAQQQGQSWLKDEIISHLESLNASALVDWTLLSQMFDKFVDERKEKAQAAADDSGNGPKFELVGNKLTPVDPNAPAKPLIPAPVISGIESIPITYTPSGCINSTTVSLLARAITLSRPGDGAVEFVQRMLENGADPNLAWPGGSTSPFLEACRNNRLPLAELMLKEYRANPLMGRRLGNYQGANPGLALPFAFQHAPNMIIAIARKLQALPTRPHEVDQAASAASTGAQDELLCGIPHCVKLAEWAGRSPTLASLLSTRREAAPISWRVAAKCVHEWYRPFLQVWFESCLENANAKFNSSRREQGESGANRLERLPPNHGCAKSVHRTLPVEVSLALGGGRETTLWHVLARLGDVDTMRYLREQVLDSHGWEFALDKALDDAGRSFAQVHAMEGFTVNEQMLTETLPKMAGYAGPLARPLEAVSRVPTTVTGWWYRQERTPKLKPLTAKQRQEWTQEDRVGGWDGRRVQLGELMLPEDAVYDHKREEEGEVEEFPSSVDEFVSDSLTPHMFVHRYVLPHRPVLVRGVTSNWGWQENWRKKAFLKRYGDSQRFNVSIRSADRTSRSGSSTTTWEDVEMTLSAFVKHTQKVNGGKPKKKKTQSSGLLPIPKGQPQQPGEQGAFRRPAPGLINSRESARRDSRPFLKGLAAIPKFQGWFDGLSQNGSSFFLPQATDFSFGPGWSGLPPHVDDHSWTALAFGARRWALWPPGADNGAMQLPSVRDEHWLNETLPKMMNLDGQTGTAPAEGNSAPLLVTMEAGDVLYVPRGWIRGWVNLQESIGITEVFRPNWSVERALAFVADPLGHTLIGDMALIDGD